MFEISVAWKYLLPRRRQLSVSIISLISIFVIALVVWLVVLFFSITNGMEKHWITKLIAVTAPVRLTPTPAYYNSYYYQVDGISDASGYARKSIGGKLIAPQTDPYDPFMDEEIPQSWPRPDRLPDGKLKDPVKEAFAAVASLNSQFPGIRAADYETAFGNIRLRLTRSRNSPNAKLSDADNQSFLAQAALFGSFDPEHRELRNALVPLRSGDIDNVLHQLQSSGTQLTDSPAAQISEQVTGLPPEQLRQRLTDFFAQVTIRSLRIPSTGWKIPHRMLPREGLFQALAMEEPDRILQIVIPQQAKDLQQLRDDLAHSDPSLSIQPVAFSLVSGQPTVWYNKDDSLPLNPDTPVVLGPNAVLKAELDRSSLDSAQRIGDLRFHIELALQDHLLKGTVRKQGLQIGEFDTQTHFNTSPTRTPDWLYFTDEQVVIPRSDKGDGVLLPKAFLDVGVLVGDTGYISYQSPSVSTMQEQRIPVFVSGFYDPGIIPVGGKFVLVNAPITRQIRSAYEQEDTALTNGINVSFTHFRDAEQVQKSLEKALKDRDIDRYWKVQTFRQYEFTKELLQQLGSDKNLSMVIASVIIVVACSNIVSMLIILVNDKKLEIGILRSMGASSRSIALIFGSCGLVMGLLGSLLGSAAAVLTLHQLDTILSLVERIQGYEMFNPTFYGSSMPNELSFEGLAFVLVTTTLISLIAGVIPAVKASLLKPSAILRSE